MDFKIDSSDVEMHRSSKRGMRPSSDYSVPLAVSVLLHIVVVLVAYFGLPQLYTPKPEVRPDPITIEFVDAEIDEVTQSNKAPTKKPTEIEKAPEKVEDKPRVYTPPKMTAMAPPILTEPKPPKIVEEPEDDPEPPVPEQAVQIPDEKEPEKKPVPNKKPRQKPVVPKKLLKEEDKKDEDVDPTPNQFTSLMRSLVDAKPSSNDDSEQVAPVRKKEENFIDRMGDRLTLSEQDALIQQLSGCWNYLTSGGKDAENLVVELRLFVNPDRTVREARILDTDRYNGDSFYRAAADSAMRAIRNPNCIPLRLPTDKYDQWSTIVVRFDPSEMF